MRGSNVLDCTLVRGFGEGSYFMSMPHYKKEIKNKLGFNAYPGTLNLNVGKKQIALLKRQVPIKISGFKSGSTSFGGANCYKARINDINGSIIVPELTKHKNTIEFIAPVHLKSELNLRDGDSIRVTLINGF